MKKSKSFNKLSTNNTFDRNHPLNYYPRPQLMRDEVSSSYVNLNGVWKYEIFNQNDIESIDFLNYKYEKEIVVPYAIESQLSGVEYLLKKNEILAYHLSFKYKKSNDICLLHFGAVDQKCCIYLNGNLVGSHIGGYLPFSIDVSNDIKDVNDLIILVSDPLSHHLPYGKQRVDRGGMWYTPVSGIWKTVWMECVPQNYINNLKITPDFDNKSLNVLINSYYESGKGTIKVLFNGIIIKEEEFKGLDINLVFDEINPWTPDTPNLYDLEISYEKDVIKSYFAFRKISIGMHNGFKVTMLNNNPIFMHGLLDQGYYPDGIYTPASLDVVINDLNTVKKLGFNTLRKHIKVEDDTWYYLCDKMGILVWQDFVNMFDYLFFTDTIQPTILNNHGVKFNLYNKEDKMFFLEHSLQIIDTLYNHPSIVLWTIFNEGWGEHDVLNVYDKVKFADPTRLIDPYSGWFKVGNFSDFTSKHIYFRPIKLKKTKKCLMLTEFGGYSLMIDKHHYSNDVYGYGGYPNLDEYNKAFEKLYFEQVLKAKEVGLTASIYTQVSDVEDEINGIMTYDRKVVKLNELIGKKVAEALKF